MSQSQSTSAAEHQTLDIQSVHQQMLNHKKSPIAVVDSCLDRIERLNPILNAFITVLPNQAREDARVVASEIAASRTLGPLHGIPIGIKDFYDTAGTRTTAAFEGFKERVPNSDAVGVAKLKKAGAIILGKTNMHRLGMGTTGLESAFGPVRNPWNADCIAGGSSSGSAAAVASGMCFATLDTDAIGSCRLPASCCGVVGFKGTYGLINPKGILEGEKDPGEMIHWLSHPGIMGRRVEDVAIVLDVLAERPQKESVSYLETMREDLDLRVGVAINFDADRTVREAFMAAVEQIRRLGYSITNVAAPLHHPVNDVTRIEADRRLIVGKSFHEVDVLLLPTTVTTVPTIEEANGDSQALSAANTVFANYYGLPAITIPSGFDRNGLPVGLQIVGKPWDETIVLHLAYRYEMATTRVGMHPGLQGQ
jgi:aspartyl-tRNA(Asn)/glutamyl-tRNA(Gln) amidotransferase subunit A